jgi:hypothetical protein
MAKCKLLAFVLCERASVAPEPDNRVTLHHLFDRMILPRNTEETDLIFAYYKIVVEAPCTVALRVIDPQQRELPRIPPHSIERVGPIQGVWALHTGLFEEPGVYVFELREESDGPEPYSLASTNLVVDLEGK